MSNINYTDLTSVRLSVHIEWNELQKTASQKLSDLLGRDIIAESRRDEYYYWGFYILRTPLSKEEIEKLFAIMDADDYDRDSNDFGEYPITEINQGLAEKIMADELPFTPNHSHADDEGVWFFGPLENEQLNILVTYPETDMEPDVFSAILNSDTSKDTLQSCFDEAKRELADDDETDRLTRLDTILDRVTVKAGCKKIGLLPIAFEVEIQ